MGMVGEIHKYTIERFEACLLPWVENEGNVWLIMMLCAEFVISEHIIAGFLPNLEDLADYVEEVNFIQEGQAIVTMYNKFLNHLNFGAGKDLKASFNLVDGIVNH